MKTLEDALSVAGIIPHGVFEGEIGDIFFLAENEAGPRRSAAIHAGRGGRRRGG